MPKKKHWSSPTIRGPVATPKQSGLDKAISVLMFVGAPLTMPLRKDHPMTVKAFQAAQRKKRDKKK